MSIKVNSHDSLWIRIPFVSFFSFQLASFSISKASGEEKPSILYKVSQAVTFWLAEEVKLSHHKALMEYLDQYFKELNSLSIEEVQETIANFLSEKDSVVMENVKRYSNLRHMLAFYLSKVGKSSFEATFKNII